VRNATEPMAMFPLQTVLFPRAELPLHVFETRYRALVADCLARSGEFGVVLIARGSEVGGGEQRTDVGTVARIELASRLEDGRWVLMTRGVRRVRVGSWLPDAPYPAAEVADAPDEGVAPTTAQLEAAEASVRRVRALTSELGRGSALEADQALPTDPFACAWELCAQAPLGPLDNQVLLSTDDPGERLTALVIRCEALAEDAHRLLAAGDVTSDD
jgi:uncharacterized protein